MKLLFIQTGGTIDKIYPHGKIDHGYEFEIGSPAFKKILKRVKPEFEVENASILKKDSKDLTDEDRELILDYVNKSKADKIIITHGTSTLSQTAKFLAGVKDKVVVITGASLPEKFYDSDADFNLGMAVATAQTEENGVYIALNGTIETIS